ncbi:putative aspartate aminotransferase 2 [Desulfamplus magnetovallimortis]|uniref:Aminotransferase n=1 Tax=Desulfamplus magnetovallimortis TaxID=1246637 RepID=A0A1W1H9E3_9BACT|nr:pyridoxal phosphate-dependent aminotransferase [Desulfamplus magnetovallimortis]SLM29064.1 putative aspartate aminotransferase 2 [Desulfamplus magnetovallimortis]
MASFKAAERTNEITPFLVMEIMEKIHEMEARGIDVVHLEIGEPDFDTPECVRSEVTKAFECGETSYTHSLGDPRLRNAISEYYQKTYNVDVAPGRIVVTSGTSPAMLLLFSALLDPGDEVIIPDPHYICYPNFIRFTQGVPVMVPVYEKDAFQYTPQAISEKITSRTKAILVNSPSNPTGNVMPWKTMEEIVALADQHGIAVISDEIYHGLVYGDDARSMLEVTDSAFVFNGFSKLFAMTGLRLGYLIAPEAFIRPVQILQQNFFICANSVIQLAGTVALKESEKEIVEMRRIYDQRRQYIIKRLKAMGFGITVEPTGAFYVFANAKKFSLDSYGFAMELLENAHVGITPGIAFGKNGEGYLRFSYANSMENIEKAMDRLENYLNNRQGG